MLNDADINVRNATYRRFVELGRAPSVGEVAAAVNATDADVREVWARLHDAHAVVLDEGGEIAMANPFAVRPTPFLVHAAARDWYANCAWDAFGIGAALHVDSTFQTSCPDCREPIRIQVVNGKPDDASPVFHVLVPARDWWADIGFT